MQRHSLFTSRKCKLFQQSYRRQLNRGESMGKFLKPNPMDNKHPLNPVVNMNANYTLSFVFITTNSVHVSINSTLGSPLFLIKNVFLIQPYTYK